MKTRYLAVMALLASPLVAQAQTDDRPFNIGTMVIGPVVGLGGLGGASLSFGGRFERGFRAMPEFGGGIMGLGIQADWWSYNQDFGAFGGKWNYTYIPIGVTGNYHFHMKDNPKLDPYIGAGLGYSYVSSSWTGSGTTPTSSNASAIYFIGVLGAHYYFSPTLAVHADVGAGAALLNVGLMWKIGTAPSPKRGSGGRVN